MQPGHAHSIGRRMQWASRRLAVPRQNRHAAQAHARPCLQHKSKPQLRRVSAASGAADKTEAATSTAGRPGTEALGRRQHPASEGKWQGDASGRSAAGRSSSAGRGRGRPGRGATPPPAADTGTQQVDYSSTAALPSPPGSGHKRMQSEPPAAASSRRGDMPAAAGSRASGRASTLSSGGRGRGEDAGLRRQAAGRGSDTAGLQQRSAGGSSAGGASAIRAPLLTSLIKGSRDAPSLMQLVERYHSCSTFNHIHAAAALTLFAKLMQRQRLPRAQVQVWLDALILAARQQVYAAGPRGLVNMLHAVATLQNRVELQPSDSQFVEQLMAGLESKVPLFNGQDLSNTLWALAIIDMKENRLLVDSLASEAQRQLHQMTEQGLSNSLWALATMCGSQHSHSAFIQAWVREAAGRLSVFNPQNLSNSLWALATLCGDQHSHNVFIQAWVREAAGRLSAFNPQELSNTLWALATLYGSQHSHNAFIQAWVREAAGRLSAFNPQELSNTLWALATFYVGAGDQHRHNHFIQAWVREAECRLSGFKPQALSNSLWALSKLGHTDCGFTARLLQEAKAQLPLFNAQDVSNTALALATLRYQDPDFMRQLSQHARSRLPDFTSQQLANTLWAMAWLHYNEAAFADDAVRRLLQQRDSLNRQDICNTLWALCILDHSSAAVLQPLLAQAQSMLLPGTAAGRSDEQQKLSRCQAYQYLVTMEGQGHISPQLKAQYRQLWEVCQAAWAEQLQQGARTSFTQQQVLQAVRELPGCEGATCEQLTEDGLLSVDVAVQLSDGTKVAVEVDGPMHFMANTPDVPDGSTLWRNRMLRLRGWSVVSVPVVQWSRLGSDTGCQQSYLQQRFAQAAVQLL